MAKCFQTEPAEYGWCATCDPEAKEGQPGFCYTDKPTENEWPQILSGKYNSNWGFCDSLCEQRNAVSENFHTMELQVRRTWSFFHEKLTQFSIK